ncbi:MULTISPECIES: hypothetical protein [unclassified Cryobacterium]|uniref:hypothetical protein n=2 Tax=Cryobacterium TaxID=69578 RepID=UPI002AB55C00|nr:MULTISPECIES: hypothetical protein [unclassified Cryobacterium]MDY7526507.1 hypothetical protein [Cryobacterium sp. 10C2]MDY7557682.1 hypothetical protein [Cryobacterium sp. 10C3]MEA9999679.1 hypothetical protein [Cryobacterium sp. RTS3]MEB0289865.1 hypothetical protein [Cryobacterium sp. 10C2]
MKRMSFCGMTFLTTDAVADAVLELTALLTYGHNSELLVVPSFTLDGSERIVNLLVGPGSELISIPEDDFGAERDTSRAVAVLRDQIDVLTSERDTGITTTRAVASSSADWASEDHWDDVY